MSSNPIILFCLLLLVSCTWENSEIAFEYDEYSSPRIVAARSELSKLEKQAFGDADQFVIDPIILAKEDYAESDLWSHWKKELNHREDEIPSGVILYSGDAGDNYGSGKSIEWENQRLFENEHFSVSNTGKILEHVYVDSTLFYYDSNDRLRKTISFDKNDPNEIEYIRLFDYDNFGNIRWSATFFQNDQDSIYLNHYRQFSYHKTDSGYYAKENQYFVRLRAPGSLEKSVNYSFFNHKSQLKREFHTFISGGTGINFYTHTFNSKGERTTVKEFIDLDNGRPVDYETNSIDSLDRKTYFCFRSKGIFGPVRMKDSIIYNDKINQKQEFTSENGDLLNGYYILSHFDDYANVKAKNIFEFSNSHKMVSFRHENAEYELTKAGTWYYQKCKEAFDEEPLPDDWNYFEYRQFLNKPVYPIDGKYREDPILTNMIEYWILSHL